MKHKTIIYKNIRCLEYYLFGLNLIRHDYEYYELGIYLL